MKAVYLEKFGATDVLKYGDLPDPEPGTGQVLVEVHACSLNPLDWKLRKGTFKFMTGRKFPKVLGADFSGVVSKIGQDVTYFKKGDAVFGGVNIMFGKMGANAELVVVSEKHIAAKPENITFEEAAAIPVGGLTAFQSMKKIQSKPSDKVLINGASGGVGVFALQLAKMYGAEVTAVCGSTSIEFVKSLGADLVIDYKKDDFTQQDRSYDLIFDAHGTLRWNVVKKSLLPNGIFISTLPSPGVILGKISSKLLGGKKIILASVRNNPEDLSALAELVGAKKIKVPIQQTFSLRDTQAAHDMLEKGGVKGKLVIKVK